jgi:putative membrane protein
MFYMHGIGWGWWLLMSVGMLAFWALVVYGILWLVRGGSLVDPREASQESPKAILRRRLARGEISVEEYERLLKAIEPPSSDNLAA